MGYINIRSAPTFKPRVPHLTDKIFGRDKEAQDIIDTLLNHSRPRVAILGSGGMGKTSLALVVMADIRIIGRYPHRYFISCEAALTADAILSEMADVMHIPVENRASYLQLYILDRLRDEKALICFDNFETPWEDGSSRHLIDQFISSFDGIEDSALLLTMRGSQRPDGVGWSKPHFRELDQLPLFHSKEIFQEIADQAVDDDAEKLLQNVKGIPLAAKLIASIIRDGSETTSGLLSRWSQEKTSLVETGEHRLTSLDISIALSYGSYRMKKCPEAPDILILFAFLPDGFPQQDNSLIRKALSKALDSINLQKAIQTLLTVSLIYIDRQQPHNIRYRILPPIRHYCSRLAFKQPLLTALTEVYIKFITENYQYGDPDLHPTVLPELANTGEMISRALDNVSISENVLFAASDYSDWCHYTNNYSDAFLIQKALQCGSSYDYFLALGNCYWSQGIIYESVDELEKAQGSVSAALELHRKAQSVLGEANDLTLLGDVQMRRGELDKAEELFSAALKLHQKVQNVTGEANNLRKLGDLQVRQDGLEKAEKSFSAALELHRKVQDVLGEANDLDSLGDLQMRRNELEKAEESFSAALELHRNAQDILGEANNLASLGDVQIRRNELEKAEELFSAALELHRKVHSVLNEATDLHKLGDVQMQRNELGKAEESFSAALGMHRKAEDVLGTANDLHRLGDVQMRRNELGKAEESFSAALELHRKAEDDLGTAHDLTKLGIVQMQSNELKKAEESFSAALELHQKGQDVLGEAYDLAFLDYVQTQRNAAEKAEESFSAVLEASEGAGCPGSCPQLGQQSC
jgi:tetratricopeptide (TPR) repeat protein